MNSTTPIISISETLTTRTAEGEINEKDFNNMREALSVINRRGKGLLSFVENYRKLSKLPEPEKKETNLASKIMFIVLCL